MSTLGTAWLLAVGSRPHRPTTPDDVAEALSVWGVDGATLLPCRGVWKGETENSVLVLVAGLTETEVCDLAGYLAERFEQEAVYVQQAGLAHLVTRAVQPVAAA